MSIRVYMRSDEFGYEEFPRDTIDEALATIKNLRQKALDLDDDVEREIGLLVNAEPSEGYEVVSDEFAEEYPGRTEAEARAEFAAEYPDVEILEVNHIEYTD